MKNFVIVIGLFISSCITVIIIYNQYVFDNVPDGDDVKNAISIQNRISYILATDLAKTAPGDNIVMMAERRNEFAVGIKNATPSIEAVSEIISMNSRSIVGDHLVILFYNNDMKLMEECKVIDGVNYERHK